MKHTIYATLNQTNTKEQKKVKSEVTWLLTGTPIQNKNDDLYSQLKIMGIYKEFEAIETYEGKLILFHRTLNYGRKRALV